MAPVPHYHSSYPRSGDVALLCEGDLVGYETSILRRWLDQHLGTNPLVDLWPCGTGAAIFGMSDAIGRSRPIAVIEDRDYKAPSKAAEQSANKKQRREERGLSIAAWQTWRRNEIENYLLEPEVAVPCLASVFECARGEVEEVLEGLLPCLVVHQTFQHAFYHTRQIWEATDSSPILPNSLSLSPVWDDQSLHAASPDFETAFQQFERNFSLWRTRLGLPAGADSILAQVKSRHLEWERPSLNNRFWLHDWSGKDILQWLRIALTARFGWRDRDTGARTRIAWAGLNRARRDAQDRPIETELKPFLVHSFLDHLSGLKSGELHDEWHGLIGIFSAYRRGQNSPA
jgi:hypothetical protein